MEVVYERCAGLDVHKKSVVACRLRGSGVGREKEIKSFGTTTRELLKLSDWLKEWECSHVAMESSGDYWKPIYNILEGEFEVVLVNAKHIKHVPGRKSDVKDAEWLADLLQHGLLKGSFIPPKGQRELRELTRYRRKLIQEKAREINRVQKVLEGCNIKLSSVVSDVMGASGRSILDAIVSGERDARKLAQLAKGRARGKLAQLEEALEGFVEEHHRFLLARQLAHIDFLHQQIEILNDRIESHIREMSQSPPSEGVGCIREQEAIELLDTIPGINRRIAEVIVAEVGVDMSRFGCASHLASWAGLAPGNNESGGKHYGGRTKKGNEVLRSALVQAAWGAVRVKDSYLSAQYHRLAARRGNKRAIVAVVHSMIVIIYHMLKRGERYQDLGGDYFDRRRKESVVNRLMRKIQRLGYMVHVEPAVS